MISLKKKLEDKQKGVKKPRDQKKTNITIRDTLLVQEIQELNQFKPTTCELILEDPNVFHQFSIVVRPDEGYWKGGVFRFDVSVPEEYNIMPPKVICRTRVWHPNISEEGQVCLSLLRQNSLDSMGWAPTRKLKDVVWGITSLFSDLLNFDDPLNVQAANHYARDKINLENSENSFIRKASDYIYRYAK